MNSITPAQLEDLTGLKVANQRQWRARGFLDLIGEGTEGGHARYSAADVLAVSIMRTLTDLGVELSVANRVALQITGTVSSLLRNPASGYRGGPDKPFFFVWRFEDTFPGAEHVTDRKPILGIGGEFAFLPLFDLNDIKGISRSGGQVISVDEIVRRLPPKVVDLFLSSAA